MTTVSEIEQAFEKLPDGDLLALREWIVKRDSDAWDRQIEADIKAGRLEHLMEKALADDAAGRTTPFPPLDDEQGE